MAHHYTDKTYYEYDQTLTQTLLTQYINTLSSTSSIKTDQTYLGDMVNMSRFTGSRHEPNPDISSGESEEPRPSTVTHDYRNFISAAGVNFDQARSAAIAAGVDPSRVKNAISLNDTGLQATNITFAEGGAAAAYASNTTLSNLTFLGKGGVVEIGGGFVNDANDNPVYVGGQSLNGLKAEEDLDKIILYPPSKNAATSAVTATNITVSRNLTDLAVAAATYFGYYGQDANSNFPGTGVEASNITVHGALRYVNIGSGAHVSGLTVGDWKEWGDGEASAFLGEDVWGSTSHMSATYMNVYSGGTATNINLGFGGELYVSGPGMIYSSQLVSSAGQSWYETTSSEGTGAGGVLTNLKMAVGGGIQFTGNGASELNKKLWDEPRNGYLNSSSYQSGFLAGAPQSAYVSFGKFTSGNNIEIGNGGSMRIDSGASVNNISMTALSNTSIWVAKSSGGSDMWIGDRGAMLTINDNAVVSNVYVQPANMTFDYYSAAHDYYWLYSSSVSSSMQAAYYSANSSSASGSAWEAQVKAALTNDGYRQYMSNCFISGGHNTNLGDDTNGYNHKYVGGSIGIGAAYVDKISGFATLSVTGNADVSSSGGKVTYSALNGSVTNASGALSATVNVGGGAPLSNVVVQGGYVVMGYNSGGVARWTGSANPQSNFALVENLDLRTSGLVGDNNSAVIFFYGYNHSNGWSTPRKDSKGNYITDNEGNPIYDSYSYDCMDPGEIQYASGDSGLTVQGTYGRFTYTGSGGVVLGGLGTIWKEQAGSCCYESSGYYSSSADGTSKYVTSITRWLTPSSKHYEFGVVKGIFDEETGQLQKYYDMIGEDGFDWRGTLAVGSGAVVKDVGSKSGLKTANTLTSDSWNPIIEEDVSKKLVVLAGGSADNVAVTGKVTNYERTSQYLYKDNAALVVSSGGKATNISVLSNGMAMAVGGTIDGAFVGSGGILYLSGWGGALQVSDDNGKTIAGAQYLDETVLNNVHLDKGGQLAAVYEYQFAGKAPSIIANTGGGILNGVTANGVAYISGVDFAGAVTLAGGQKALDVTVRGFTNVTETDSNGNPTAWTTNIAYMNVSAGGIVSGATVGEDGAIYVSDGADVSNLVASGGRLIFANSSGWSDYFPGSAAVAGLTVMDGGILEVNSKFALTTMDMQIKESAGLEVVIVKDADEKYAKTELNGTWTASWGTGEFRTVDGVLSGFGGQFGFKYLDPIYSSSYTSARLSMTFLNGATLLDGDLRGYGYFSVRNGAKVLNTKIKGITANIGGGGYASGLSAMTDPTDSAYNTNIYVYGNMESGTSALAEQTVLSGGYMGIERGGMANGVTMLAPEGYEGPAGDSEKVGPAEMEIMAGGTASNVFASAGVVTISDGSSKEQGMGAATLSNAEIHSSVMLLVNADGVVLDGALKLAGTVVTTATRYEYVEVEVTDPSTGNTYTDWQRVEKNNAVADAKTLTVSFDLTEHSEGFETAMIDNMANLDGAKYEFIYVNEDQKMGSYVLAGNAQDYRTGALKVVRGGKFAGTITVSDGWGVLQVEDDLTYTVNHNANNELVFSVETTEAAITNIVATSNGKELLKGKWSKYSVNIKTEVNKYSTSIWYRIKQAVKTRGLLKGVGDDDEGWLELDNEKGLDVAEYCTVELKAKNEAGKDSEIVTYTVNYDATAPEISGLCLVSGEPFLTDGMESAVTVSVMDNLDDAPALQFSLNDGVWTDVVRNDDGNYVFDLTGGIAGFTLRATDHADNVNTLVISIPAAPTVSADILTVTNQDVTLTAQFSENSTLRQYSLDGGGTWQDYDKGVVLDGNGIVSFRAGNILGYSAVTDLAVDYIDKDRPKAPTAKADITELTNRSVTVTAEFSEDSVKKLYSLDGGETWADYDEGGVIIIINGTTVGFCGVDEAGNTSDVTNVVIDNIDTTEPVITLSGDNETPLQSSTLTAEADDGSEILYSLDQKEWFKYEGVISVTENATYYFKATDAAGNTGTAEYVFENIDTTAPVITLAGDNETPLQASTLTAEADDGSEIMYSLDQKEWFKYEDVISVTKNATYYFKATDAAGNASTAEYVFENIDTTAPEAPVASADITELTNKDVTVTAEFSEDSVKRLYSLDGGKTWADYDDDGVIIIINGTTVGFCGVDEAGNTSDVTNVVIDNIDKEPPNAPAATADITELTNKDVTVTATFSEDSALKQYSLNGKTWLDYTGGIVFDENGTVLFRAADAVGNESGIVAYAVDNIVVNGPDHNRNDSAVDSDGKLNTAVTDSEGIAIEAGAGEIRLDTSVNQFGDNDEEYRNYIGGDDPSDCTKIVLAKAARLTFSLDTTGAAKFVVSKLVEGTGRKAGTFKLKPLQTTSVSKQSDGKETGFLLLESGEYFITVTGAKRGGAGTFYNIELIEGDGGAKGSKFFVDGDNGDNNWLWTKSDGWNDGLLNSDALTIDGSFLEEGEGKDAVQIDTDAETVVSKKIADTTYTNFVGFGDAADFRKIELKSAAKLSFDLAKTTGGAAKLLVYTVNDKGKMVVADSKLTTTVKAIATSGGAKNQVVLQKGVYYIAVQATDAKKGNDFYYNVSLNQNSVFFADGDGGGNNYNSKTKRVDALVDAVSATRTLVQGQALQIDGAIDGGAAVEYTDADGKKYTNFVGTGDDSDVVRINANDGMKVSLKVTATDAVSLVIYGLQKNGTLKALKTVKSKDNVAVLNDFELKAKSAPRGQFYVGVTSTNAKKGSAAYYNVDVVSVSGQNLAPLSASETSALAMPETDSLAMTDALSFGGYGADVLADASASFLAELDDKTSWQNITSLA